MRSALHTASITTLFLLVSTLVYGQPETITISLKDTTVEAIIREIREQSEFDFIYNHEEVGKCPKVSIDVSQGTVKDVLTQCLINTGLSYEKVNNAYIITPQKKRKRGSRGGASFPHRPYGEPLETGNQKFPCHLPALSC